MLRALCCVTIAWFTLPFAAMASEPAKYVLRYDHPAGELPAPGRPVVAPHVGLGGGTAPDSAWAGEALPLGNGRLGCMIFGGVGHERIQFNENSLWTGDQNPSGDYGSMGAYQNFGDLFIDLPEAAKGKPYQAYERSLTLDEGVHRVTFKIDGVTHHRTMFASHWEQVLAMLWEADRNGAVSGRFRLVGAHGEKTTAKGKDREFDGTLDFRGKLGNGLEYQARAALMAQGGKVEVVGDSLVCTNCDYVLLLLAAGTNYLMDYQKNWRGPLPEEVIKRRLSDAGTLGYACLPVHRGHRKLFDRCAVDFGRSADDVRRLTTDRRLAAYRAGGKDPELEATLFQMGRYLLMSSSRRPGLPANLQGLWNNSNTPPWSSDYHTNINIQMNYWPAEVTNLSECHLPLLDLVMAMREPSRKATRDAFGPGRGWTARTSHNIFGGHGWQWNVPSSAWYALHFWEHYAFTGNKQYLREVAYPMVKEVCEYWMDHLKRRADGSLVVPNGWSPEHGPREDGVMHDQEIVWELFTFYGKMAKELGVDEPMRQQVAAMRDKLAGPKIGRWGQLQEWQADRDDPYDQHRHTSHLFAVYPGSWISVTRTPDWARAAAVSLAARGTSGDSRREWAWAWRCNLWARLHDGAHAYDMLHNLLCYNTLPNLFGVHPPMQLDGNFGITAGIAEMLVQSHAGEVELLPALPKEWPDGNFRGVCARGGFQVDCRWREGRIAAATLHSTLGGDVIVRTPVAVKDVCDADGKRVSFRRDGATVRFSTTRGGKYELQF
jgi:alpha-L-fucosidase 2